MSDLWLVMIASSNLENRQRLTRILEQQGVDAIWASTAAQSRETLESEHVGLVFCDRYFADGDYQDVLAAAHSPSAKGETRIVLTSPMLNAEQYEKAKQQGVFEVIPTPCRPTDVEWMIIQAKRKELKRPRPILAAIGAGAG